MAHMNNKLIFYHVPKTGGRWVLSAMKRAGVRGIGRAPRLRRVSPLGLWGHHSTPEAMPPGLKNGRFSFCFVRRPFDWYRSFWTFRKKGLRVNDNMNLRRPGEGSRPFTYDGTRRFPPDDLWDDEFEGFLRNIFDAYPEGFLTTVYQKYVGPDANWVDFIGRQENLRNDLIAALTLAGEMDICERRLRRLKNVNVADPEFQEQTVVDPSWVEKVEKTEKWILETFYA